MPFVRFLDRAIIAYETGELGEKPFSEYWEDGYELLANTFFYKDIYR
jgi:hypothetical protein